MRQRVVYIESVDTETKEALWEGASLRMFYEVTSNPDMDFGQKVQRLLALACQRLDMQHAILSRVQDQFYEITEIHASSTSMNKGSIFQLEKTYCELTIQSGDLVCFTEARKSHWAEHPAYKAFGYEAYIGVAVMVEGKPHGTLGLYKEAPRKTPFSDAEQTLMRLISQWIGRELERIRAEGIMALRTQEMAALYETSLDINAQPDLSTLLQAIVQRATTLLGTDMGGLSLVRPDAGVLDVVAGYNRPDDGDPIGIRLGEGLAGRIALTGEPMMVADYKHWEGKADLLADRPIGRILGVPLKQRENVVGVLNVFDEQTGVFTDEDIRLLSLFAAQAAIAINNAGLFETDRSRAEQLETLRQISLDLTTTHDLTVLLNQIVERAVELLAGDSGGINIYRPENDVLERVAAVGRASEWLGARLVRGEGIAGRVWVTGEPLIIDDYSTWSGRSTQMASISGPTVGTPIQWRDEFLGALVIRRNEGEPQFTLEEAALLSQFATHAAIAISNARLYEQAEQELAERKRAQEQTRASLREKEILLQEVNHRVKNNLQVVSSLLRVQARSIDDVNVRQLFIESQNRIDSMSLIHERLYTAKDLARIEFAAYVEDLTTSLVSFYEIASQVTVETIVDEVYLDLEMAIPCGLIINELVTNALKYAFPNTQGAEIFVSLKPDANDQLVLIVRDNGIGLPDEFDFQNARSLGLQLVSLLADQVGGTVHIKREGGTEFNIVFPALDATPDHVLASELITAG